MSVTVPERVSSPDVCVAFVSLGCRVNRVETDAIAEELRQAGLTVTTASLSDVVVVNTCAVTGEAEAKARKEIRRMASLPRGPLVVATGCLATLDAEAIEAISDEVVVEPDKSLVARRVLDELAVRDIEPRPRGERELEIPAASGVTATGRTRPGIKIQDGCDLRCAYCVVWKARGPSRSVGVEDVVAQVRAACGRGAPEVMLTGINLGCYGAGPSGGKVRLPGLLRTLLDRTDVGRLRLGSLEPQDVDDELIDVMAASGGRIAPFLHLCLQSGCDATLRRMGRVYDTALFEERVERVRSSMPQVALGTDLIVGFPGEDAAEFETSRAFCERMRFSRMHVFRFSARPGTAAASLPARVGAVEAVRRAREVRELARSMREGEARALVGSRDLVVVQEGRRGVSGGLFAAEVEGEVREGTLVDVQVSGVRDGDTLLCSTA